ncbi:hypothetical protein SM8_015360 [Streptomyces sp. SM8]|nr:hypothetical protein SM8_015360 [Streptomyces sp. SM8]
MSGPVPSAEGPRSRVWAVARRVAVQGPEARMSRARPAAVAVPRGTGRTAPTGPCRRSRRTRPRRPEPAITSTVRGVSQVKASSSGAASPGVRRVRRRAPLPWQVS